MGDLESVAGSIEAISKALQSVSYVASSEEELVAAIQEILRYRKIPFESEVNLGPYGRIDLLAMHVGIEVKHRYGMAHVLRQLDRYAQSPRLQGIILATTSRRLASGLPGVLRGKPVAAVVLAGGL